MTFKKAMVYQKSMGAPILLHTALQVEAQPFIGRLGLKKVSAPGSFELFHGSHYSLVISGMGKTRSAAAIAAAATRLFPERRDFFVVNVGIAGSPTLAVGTLCSVVKCVDRATGKDFYPDLVLSQPGVESVLETHDTPVRDAQELLSNSTLVDMEVSAVFESGRMFASTSRVQSFKVVSDSLACSIPSKAFISDLIDKHLDTLCGYLEVLQSSSIFSVAVLNETEILQIKNVVELLGLTFSQQVQIENAASYCKSKRGELPAQLPLPVADTIDSKAARARALELVRSVLEA